MQERRNSQRVLTLAIEPRFAPERHSQSRDPTRRSCGVRIVSLSHREQSINHSLHCHVRSL
jgi:hypothetical protein